MPDRGTVAVVVVTQSHQKTFHEYLRYLSFARGSIKPNPRRSGVCAELAKHVPKPCVRFARQRRGTEHQELVQRMMPTQECEITLSHAMVDTQ